MRFYTQNHKYYCGIDLHARSMYVCILDGAGKILIHRNLPSDPQAFLTVIAPYREDVVVAAECIFTWYWLADRCAREGIAFVLGHALYMKAIHGGKAKNDKIKVAGGQNTVSNNITGNCVLTPKLPPRPRSSLRWRSKEKKSRSNKSS